MPFAATWMELETHTKGSRSKGEKQIYITYTWNLIYSTNKPTYRKETNSLTWKTNLWLFQVCVKTYGLVFPRGCGCQLGRGESGMGWEFGVSRCRLLPMEWISNEILLNSTGNYI